MKTVVCIRQGRDGDINPFDACAYEEALKIPNNEITLLSMGISSCADLLTRLTRLGNVNAVLLNDSAFAGADTLATAYTLSLYIKNVAPDLVLCGRQTLEGDTAQVPTMLSQKLGYSLITNAMEISFKGNTISCETRVNKKETVTFPAVVTVERINTLRLPSLSSKAGNVTVLNAADINADISRCGLSGSPTRVLETKENQAGKRKCRFISEDELHYVVNEAINKHIAKTVSEKSEKTLDKVYCVGEKCKTFADLISDNVTVLKEENVAYFEKFIKKNSPNAIIFGSDSYGKRTSALLASKLDLGLCADCTALDTDGNQLFMIRPALSGSVIAKIKSLTRPTLATVRTQNDGIKDVYLCIGYGAKDKIEYYKNLAVDLNAELAATRKAVDNGLMPYKYQVGLTGKTVAPAVYIAVGVSGAVHHIVGMQKSGTVIAINSDKNAPIFDYADYGILI